MASGQAKLIYNYLKDTPDMTAATFAVLPRKVVTRVAGHYASLDAGRGARSSAASAPSSMCRAANRATATADDIEGIVRANAKQDITALLHHRRQLRAQQELEADPRRLIEGAKEDFKIRLLLQVDTLYHKIQGLIKKAARTGCAAVFIET